MDRILAVDDEPDTLTSMKLLLGEVFEIETALSAQAGLELLKSRAKFTVILSDLHMPEMDGIEFLEKAREISPHSIRVILTGYANLEMAIQSVNRDNVFRFLTKPCNPDDLTEVLKSAARQYHLEQTERDLLHKTLTGSIKLLSELIAVANPIAFGRANRIRPIATRIAKKLDSHKVWVMTLAAMLCQVGCSTFPTDLLPRIFQGKPLTSEEQILYQSHTEIGSSLLQNLPRLEEVALIVRYQEKHFDGKGHPYDDVHGQGIHVCSRILKAVLDFDQLTHLGHKPQAALTMMQERRGWYDPEVLKCLKKEIGAQESKNPSKVAISDLQVGSVLAEDLTTKSGAVLLPKGQQITEEKKEGIVQLMKAGIALMDNCQVVPPL